MQRKSGKEPTKQQTKRERKKERKKERKRKKEGRKRQTINQTRKEKNCSIYVQQFAVDQDISRLYGNGTYTYPL